MPKDVTKLLALTISKLEIGVSTDDLEPSYTIDPGLLHEEKLTFKADPIADKEIGGGSLQKGFDCTLETSAMQVKDFSTLESGVKNKNCWIKVTSTGGTIVKFKNVYLNVGVDLQLHTKGKTAFTISGTKYVSAIGDILVIA